MSLVPTVELAGGEGLEDLGVDISVNGVYSIPQ
jgi:hypothetical protein